MNPHASKSAAQTWEEWLALSERQARSQALRWDWFALLRLIQSANPQKPRLGYALASAQEVVRLGQPVFFDAPTTTVADFRKNGPTEAPSATESSDQPPLRAGRRPGIAWIYSHHMGLFGPNGPLPLHLTEFANQRNRQNDHAFSAFCNVLVNRFLSQFFRAWTMGRKELSLDRPTALPIEARSSARRDIEEHGEGWWGMMIGSLIGCGFDSQRRCDQVPEYAKLYYSGRLVSPVRNAEGLRAIVEDYFQIPARLVEFQPRTLPIPENTQWRLGPHVRNGRLGWTTLLGTTVVDHQSGFRLRLGPVSIAELERFLPGQDGLDQIHDWVRFYCGKETDPNPEDGLEASWDLQFVLRGAEVPECRLDRTSRLGLTSWLYSSPPSHDVEDLVISPRLRRKPPSPTEAARR